MSIFADRLLHQLLLSYEKSAEIQLVQAQLMTKSRQVTDAQQNIKALQQQLATVESLRVSLDDLNKEEESRYSAIKVQQDAKVQNMNEELKKQIELLNDRAQQLATAQRAAESDNRKMKAQIQIYNQHKASSSEKFNEIVHARESEVAKIEEQERQNASRIPIFEQLVQTEKLALQKARLSHAQIKSKVDECVARFDAIQQQLTKAKDIYDLAKQDQQRQSRKLQSLQSDREVAVKRAKASCKQRDVILTKNAVLQEKLTTLQKQTGKLQSIAEALLRNNSAENTNKLDGEQVNDNSNDKQSSIDKL